MAIEGFRVDPAVFVTGVERDRAIRSLRCYRASVNGTCNYTGARLIGLSAQATPCGSPRMTLSLSRCCR